MIDYLTHLDSYYEKRQQIAIGKGVNSKPLCTTGLGLEITAGIVTSNEEFPEVRSVCRTHSVSDQKKKKTQSSPP